MKDMLSRSVHKIMPILLFDQCYNVYEQKFL